MKILGISAHYHDSAAALIDQGEVIAAVQEERFTRQKHDPRFPEDSIRWCLEKAQVPLSELDAIVYYEKPLLKFDRILETYIANAPWGLKQFVESFPVWIKDKLFLRQQLEKSLKKIDPQIDPEKILFSEHHLSHAASAFFPSPFEKALVLTMDGVGEWSTSSVAQGRGADLHILKEQQFPHSLGLLYSAITTFCGFKVNSGEYKLMGLAPYGEPRFFSTMLDHLIDLREDGSFELRLNYFSFVQGQKMFHKRMEILLGVKARKPEGPLTQDHMDIAASIQKLLEHVLLKTLKALYLEFPQENLCLAGGVALNCVANSRLLREGPFKNIWIQPAAGDAGGSLGAALAANYLHLKQKRQVNPQDQMRGSYLGPQFSSEEIQSALTKAGLVFQEHSGDEVYARSALHLQDGKSIGWFRGPMEFGPRALGARSILADARHPEMQKKLNLQIKFRESFRPFAPIVMEEHRKEWFEGDEVSPYMLFVADVHRSKRIQNASSGRHLFGIEQLHQVRSQIPAVTHVDYSARLQTVNAERNPQIYPLLREFHKLTGCPVIVNTSFNVRGEPIVCTPEDAIRCFLGTDLDILVLENFVVEKVRQINQNLREKTYFQNFALD